MFRDQKRLVIGNLHTTEMVSKRFIKSLIPPVLLDIYHYGFASAFPKYFWKGIYARFSDVPQIGHGHEETDWIRKAVEATKRATAENEGSLLPFLVASILRTKRSTSVLDFGGSAGVSFARVVTALPAPISVEYHIVDLEVICNEGRQLFKNDSRVHFHTTIPDLKKVDIVYLGSSLQYVEDDSALLRKLSELSPEFFLFVNTPAGDIPTYISAQQNLQHAVLAYRFMNINDLTRSLKSLGYDLLFRGVSAHEYDQDNFPPDFRLRHQSNLLFGRRIEDEIRNPI